MIDLDNIPPHKPRPVRFSLKLAGLCFGTSFVVHAAVVMSLLLTPVPSASAWSSSKQSTKPSQRHVVRVTMMLSPSSFEPQPVQDPAGSSDSEPIEKVPPSPVAVPELPTSPHATEPSTLPTTARPPMPVEPIATERDVRLGPQPIALDVPRTELNDAPLPDFVEPSVSDTEAIAEQAEPVSLPEGLAVPDLPEMPVTQLADGLPNMPESTPQQASTENVETQDQTAAKASETTEQTAEASEANTEEVESPIEDNATDTPAVVYDEDSVDQRITFGKRVRPKPSMVSKRLGETGSVRILIEVDVTGELIRHEILDDAGFPRLLAAALKAMNDSTFEPAMRGEKAVRSTRVIEYRF